MRGHTTAQVGETAARGRVNRRHLSHLRSRPLRLRTPNRSSFKQVINLKTTKTLGLTIPPSRPVTTTR